MIDELGKRLSASTLAARLGMGINQVYAHAQELGRSFSHLSSRCVTVRTCHLGAQKVR